MSDLIDTTEMYLKTVYELTEEGIVPLRARIAERLGHSGPTVSQTVARMERDGLLIVSGDRHLELTAAGHDKAMRVMRKHRLAERLLVEVVGLEWPFVHDEACRWEHVMSERVERRLVAILSTTDADPYGNPIPGLTELGVVPAEAPERVSTLVDATGDDERALVLRRIGETLQVDIELLARLEAAGLVPGAAVTASRAGDTVTVARSGGVGALDLPEDLARHLFVTGA